MLKTMLRHLLLAAVVTIFSPYSRAVDSLTERAAYAASQQEAGTQLAELLAESEPIELISLDPFPPTRRPDEPGDHVGRFRVLSRAYLRHRETISPLTSALQLSMSESVDERFLKDGKIVFPPECFFPQHGFRVLRKGKEIVVLISYLCNFGYIYGLSDSPTKFGIAKSSRPLLESIFTGCGLPASKNELPIPDNAKDHTQQGS